MNTTELKTMNPGSLVHKPSLVVILFALCFSFWLIDFWRPVNIYNGETLFVDPEIFARYSYLPALFLNEGSFEWNDPKAVNNPIGPLQLRFPKYNYGSALLFSPFFAITLLQSTSEGEVLDGFSVSFANAIHWSAIFYVMCGLFFLRRFLLHYFTENVTAVTLFVCLFGSSLFFYTYSKSELPQSQLFFLFTVFMWSAQKWHEQFSAWQALLCGIVLAIASLINIFEIYILLFFLLWNVHDKNSMRKKGELLWKYKFQVLLLLLVVFVLWIPQLWLNQHYSGRFFYDATPKEKYDFSDARLNDILFGYNYGLITYSPLMVMALIGIFMANSDFGISRCVFVCITLLVLVVYSSWWDRGYGDHFGARRMCPTIAWLSAPLAFVIQKVFKEGRNTALMAITRWLFIGFVVSCVCLMFAQTYQVLHKRIVPGKMDQEKYWNTLRTFKFKE